MSKVLLNARLSVDYPGRPGVLCGLELDVRHGEILGLVGQSGCGKSTLSLAILRLLHLKRATAAGSLLFDGRDLMKATEREMRAMRGKEIALVLQSPMSALNPALRIGTQMAEAWRIHARGDKSACKAALLVALEHVSLPAEEAFLRRMPAEISVGQAQRVLIAMATLHKPALLIADEPTSALDIITQAEILKLFRKLSQEMGSAVLFISHDLLSVATISDRIAVMEQGAIVECGTAMQVFTSPVHAYTQKLIDSLPVMPKYAAAAVGRG